MDPSSSLYVRDIDKYGSIIESTVTQHIIKMGRTTDRILIPIIHRAGIGQHWTLLVFYINKRRFEHFNSFDKAKSDCLENAKVMDEFCLEHINKFLDHNNFTTVDKVDMVEVEVPQGDTKNSLLYVRHFIKRRSKYDSQNFKEFDFKSEKELIENMDKKRVALVHSLLTAKDPEISWKMSDKLEE
ncbi:uncharacterized protein LOC113274135 [Papaver somniferum]|uniref:uncharacterized protein LOC113274135 n=1 Tax=Papaver somniferum TaxID=3469 RepID=UPI000E7011B6|nr:uncharacterized protein LOC113274135 [Papaver somniferum]XP_026379404.1 uncharacterized protein LOC113274135 [Papaver somniferum]